MIIYTYLNVPASLAIESYEILNGVLKVTNVDLKIYRATSSKLVGKTCHFTKNLHIYIYIYIYLYFFVFLKSLYRMAVSVYIYIYIYIYIYRTYKNYCFPNESCREAGRNYCKFQAETRIKISK